MSDIKRLRDPIYGYIEIPKEIMSLIVDSAEFQRLRNIIQTSYAPLYSSAVHNRFVHSLGVYHLGEIVAKTIKKKSLGVLPINDLDRVLEIFKLACLLHDLGHSPFSHTGENYYLNNGRRDRLHKEIVALTNDDKLDEEIESKNYNAAPHELMSVIVALKKFNFLFHNNLEKSFFARCILGYPYTAQTDLEHSFLNCIISFLNSSVIDVDKLDYLIRDAYLTGFDTVSIDYERLLKSVNIIEHNNEYTVVYAKSAISVIENVVYAHDAERKWIQNHPVVQYEAYLLHTAIDVLKEKYQSNNLFSYESLTVEGADLTGDYKISLLSDADIIFLMKNEKHTSIDEYFQRSSRRHPLWKSEPEFKVFLSNRYSDEMLDKVDCALDELSKQLNFVCKSQVIDQKALDALKQDLKVTKQAAETGLSDKSKMELLIKGKEKTLKWVEIFKEFAENQSIEFDFVIIRASQFNSGFSKAAFGNLLIEFDSVKEPKKFKDITNVLKADRSSREKFFYLYYRRNNDNKDIDIKVLAKLMAHVAIGEVYDEKL